MNEENKPSLKKRLSGILKTKRGQNTVIVMLIAVAALILIADFTPQSRAETAKSTSPTAEGYEKELEARLERILESIEGVGESEIIVTLSGSGETVFVSEKKESHDSDKNSDGSEKTSNQTEESYIIIEDGNGGQTALYRKYTMPEINGVVIACDGGDSTAVKERVVAAVKTALNIGSDRIYVTLRRKNQ